MDIMFRQRRIPNRSGQNLMEYTLLLGVIMIILFTMSPLVKRGSQGMIKFVADQVGNQQASDQSFEEEGGYLVNALTNSSAQMRTETIENVGITGYDYNDSTTTSSSQYLDMGFSKDN